MAKDAKGHGSDAHQSGVEQVGQPLQPHGAPVPANAMGAIEGHLGAGGELFVPSVSRPLRITPKAYAGWAKAGQPLLRPEGEGYRMRQGKGSVYLLPNQLRFTHP